MTIETVLAACDSIRPIDGNACRILAGSNDGYFIECRGLSCRFAAVEDAVTIAAYYMAICAEEFGDDEPEAVPAIGSYRGSDGLYVAGRDE